MRCRRSAPKPASAGSISTFSSGIASLLVLQLDDDLAVGLAADVARRLHATAANEHSHPRDHLGLQVLPVRTLGVGLGHHGDSVAAELDPQMVEVVAVGRALLARRQTQLPRFDAVVLEEEPRADVAEDTVGHWPRA